MIFEKGKLYKFSIDEKINFTVYTGEVIKEDENFIIIIDKFNQKKILNKKYISRITEVGGQN